MLDKCPFAVPNFEQLSSVYCTQMLATSPASILLATILLQCTYGTRYMSIVPSTPIQPDQVFKSRVHKSDHCSTKWTSKFLYCGVSPRERRQSGVFSKKAFGAAPNGGRRETSREEERRPTRQGKQPSFSISCSLHSESEGPRSESESDRGRLIVFPRLRPLLAAFMSFEGPHDARSGA